MSEPCLERTAAEKMYWTAITFSELPAIQKNNNNDKNGVGVKSRWLCGFVVFVYLGFENDGSRNGITVTVLLRRLVVRRVGRPPD